MKAVRPMKVFFTGATGFVGSHVARAYAAAGAELRLLTRASSRLAAIEGLAADVVVGDLRQPEGLRTALRGCDALVHVAADYRLWVRDPQEMYAANVDGTRELLRIAREEGRSQGGVHVERGDDGVQSGRHDRGSRTTVQWGLADMIGLVQAVEVHGRAGGD